MQSISSVGNVASPVSGCFGVSARICSRHWSFVFLSLLTQSCRFTSMMSVWIVDEFVFVLVLCGGPELLIKVQWLRRSSIPWDPFLTTWMTPQHSNSSALVTIWGSYQDVFSIPSTLARRTSSSEISIVNPTDCKHSPPPQHSIFIDSLPCCPWETPRQCGLRMSVKGQWTRQLTVIRTMSLRTQTKQASDNNAGSREPTKHCFPTNKLTRTLSGQEDCWSSTCTIVSKHLHSDNDGVRTS